MTSSKKTRLLWPAPPPGAALAAVIVARPQRRADQPMPAGSA